MSGVVDVLRSRRELRRPEVFEASSRPPAKSKRALKRTLFNLAGGEGFEPPLAESESAVLPLDDPPKVRAQLKV